MVEEPRRPLRRTSVGNVTCWKESLGMTVTSSTSCKDLPPVVQEILTNLVESAQACFQDDLVSVLLFGSGAEGRLRPSSDINVLVALKRYEKARVDAFREPLRAARMAGRVAAMFVLESELPAAAEAFAVKFEDIANRHRVLWGADVAAGLTPSRDARLQRLRQVLMNLALRLRGDYAALSLREEQLIGAIAEVAGPLRAAAATLLRLEGAQPTSPKDALAQVAGELGGASWSECLARVSQARETGDLAPGQAGGVILTLAELAKAMHARAERLA